MIFDRDRWRFTRRHGSASFGSWMKRKVYRDPVVEAFMTGVDRTLLRENLKLTPAQRLEKLLRFSSFAAELRRAGKRARLRRKGWARSSTNCFRCSSMAALNSSSLAVWPATSSVRRDSLSTWILFITGAKPTWKRLQKLCGCNLPTCAARRPDCFHARRADAPQRTQLHAHNKARRFGFAR